MSRAMENSADYSSPREATMPHAKIFHNRGDELRHLIKSARCDLERWERELDSYCLAISPVQRLPSEVLSLIFEHYLYDCETNPPTNLRMLVKPSPIYRRRIRRLLLVCRQWYQVSTLDPNLWTDISIKIQESETDIATYVKEITQYVVACIERSRFLLLNIDLDLKALRSLCSVEHGRLISQRLSDLETGQQTLNFGLVAPIVPPSLPLPFKDSSHIEGLLCLLAGKGSQHMSRWKALTIRLPGDSSTTRGIWAVINGKAPNLTTLSVHGSRSAFTFGGPAVADNDLKELKDLQNLTSLRLRDIDDFNQLQAPLSSIRSLDVDFCLSDTTIKKLTLFEGLRTLRLFPSFPYAHMSNPSEIPLSLPHLTEIRFVGYHKGLKEVTYQLPSLQVLHICDPLGRTFQSLPDVRATHIHFPSPMPSGERKDKERSLTRIRQMAVQYPDANRFTLYCHNVAEEEENVAHLKQTGALPMALETSVLSISLMGPEWF